MCCNGTALSDHCPQLCFSLCLFNWPWRTFLDLPSRLTLAVNKCTLLLSVILFNRQPWKHTILLSPSLLWKYHTIISEVESSASWLTGFVSFASVADRVNPHKSNQTNVLLSVIHRIYAQLKYVCNRKVGKAIIHRVQISIMLQSFTVGSPRVFPVDHSDNSQSWRVNIYGRGRLALSSGCVPLPSDAAVQKKMHVFFSQERWQYSVCARVLKSTKHHILLTYRLNALMFCVHFPAGLQTYTTWALFSPVRFHETNPYTTAGHRSIYSLCTCVCEWEREMWIILLVN